MIRFFNHCLFVIFLFSGFAQAQQDVTIALLSDARLERASLDANQLKQEIVKLVGREFNVTFDERYRFGANWNEEKIKQLCNKALKDDKIDIIIALGLLNANYLARTPLNKPVIAPFIIDPQLQDIPLVDGRSNLKNFTYITDKTRPTDFISTFQGITPFNKFAIVVDNAITDSIPSIKKVEKIFKTAGLDARMIPAGQSGEETLRNIDSEQVEAVLLAPLPRFNLTQIKTIADGLLARKIPGFTFNGRQEVEQGLLAGYSTEQSSQRLIRRLALITQRILLGEKPEQVPVIMDFDTKTFLNQATAHALNRFPSFAMEDNYVIINRGQYSTRRPLGLREAMRRAMQQSLDVLAAGYQTNASKAALGTYKARLLPNIGFSGDYTQQDKDLARIGNAEKKTQAQVSFSQAIYSNDAQGLYAAQKYQHLSREKALQQQRLDAALNAAITYLNLLKAKELTRLQQENLERASRNLELAKVRKKIGAASAGEVYRWESEIATSRINRVKARSQMNQLNVALLSLLNLPQTEVLDLETVTLTSAGFFFNDKRFDERIKNPWTFRAFHNFMVSEAILTSPELQQIEAQLKAQEQALTTAKRKHWAPSVTFQAGMTDIMDTGGKGSSSKQEDTFWQAGLNLSLPVYSGGADQAAVAQARETLLAFNIKSKSLLNTIEKNVCSQLLAAEASYPTMMYSADAAKAADKNLKLVTD
ncbi:MAG: hypothetical protein CSA49_04470, partial [Gammaproteobacteria bacterium]